MPTESLVIPCLGKHRYHPPEATPPRVVWARGSPAAAARPCTESMEATALANPKLIHARRELTLAARSDYQYAIAA